MGRTKYRKWKVARGVPAKLAEQGMASKSHLSRVIAGERPAVGPLKTALARAERDARRTKQ